MLSKVLTEQAADAKPVAWLRGAASADAASPARSGPKSAADPVAAVEQQVRQAYDNGLRAGEEIARKKLDAEVRATMDRLTAAIADVAATRADVIQRAETDTVRLAIEIARRILHRELTVDPNALMALTRAALEKLQTQEIHRVRVHPGQEQLVRASLQEHRRGQSIEVIADPSQPPGGILFDIGRGALDASVGTQLDEIVRGLTDRMGNRI